MSGCHPFFSNEPEEKWFVLHEPAGQATNIKSGWPRMAVTCVALNERAAQVRVGTCSSIFVVATETERSSRDIARMRGTGWFVVDERRPFPINHHSICFVENESVEISFV